MLQKRLTVLQLVVCCALLVAVAGAGFTYYWNYRGPALGGKGKSRTLLTGLRKVVVNVLIPHEEPGSNRGFDGPVPTLPARDISLNTPPTPPTVKPILSIEALPIYPVSASFAQHMQGEVSDKVGQAGFSLVSGLPATSSVDEGRQPGFVNVVVSLRTAHEGIWITTDVAVLKNMYRDSQNNESESVPVWNRRRGPELYREKDVEKAVEFQVDSCIGEFLEAYRRQQ